jgi:aerobic carbon-monoxide dehydrogenase medium subunit
MQPFELAEPGTLREALALLDPDDVSVRAISGGTALMLMMKAGVLRPRRLVSLRKLGLSAIAVGPGGELRVGAMTTLGALERSKDVKRGWPVIARALRTLSNVRVRNVATVGGGLAHADPHMDLPPLLSALGAQVTITSPSGERVVPAGEISAGYLETTLRPDELITGLEVPALGARRAAYLKCTTRSVDDWPAVGIAVVFSLEEEIFKEMRIVVSAATDRPTRLLSSEKILEGHQIEEKILQEASEAATAGLQIESDLHGSAAYKKHLIGVYLRRAIHEASGAVH